MASLSAAVLEQLAPGAVPIVDTARLLERNPKATLELFQDFDAQKTKLEAELGIRSLRFRHVPGCLAEALRSTKELRQRLLGRFVTLSGLVASAGCVKALQISDALVCACGARCAVQASLADGHLPEPPRCGCGGAWRSEGGEMVDYQEIRLQDISGLESASGLVVLSGSLVSSAVPGDVVVLGGVLRFRWPEGRRLCVRLVVEANDLRPLNQAPKPTANFLAASGTDRFSWRRALIRAVAPHLQGLEVPKLAVLLVLLGEKEDDTCTERRWSHFDTFKESGARTRRKCHLLLMGDPGTGKTQLLQAAAELSPNSVMTSASGATKSGLTFSCVRDGPGWALEVGALSMADEGVCCIDEFRNLAKEEKSALYEAMEQQSISVAKSGIACQLRARCSILAAQGWAAPQGDSLKELSGLPEPLLSRFDLILALRTAGDKDEEVAEAILGAERGTDSGAEQLQDFIQMAKQCPLAAPAEDATTLLEKYFKKLQQGPFATVSARTLESLIRLTRAHARLMQHGSVQLEDAVAVIFLHQVAWRSHSAREALLADGSLGLCAEHLRGLDFSSDLSCRRDYEAVEGAVLWMLGLQKDKCGLQPMRVAKGLGVRCPASDTQGPVHTPAEPFGPFGVQESAGRFRSCNRRSILPPKQETPVPCTPLSTSAPMTPPPIGIARFLCEEDEDLPLLSDEELHPRAHRFCLREEHMWFPGLKRSFDEAFDD